MTKRGMRGFAAGLWVAAAVIAYFFYTGQDTVKTEAEPALTKEQVSQYLETHHQIAVDQEEYQSLQAAAKKQANKEDNGKADSDKSSNKNNSDKEQKKKQKTHRYKLHIKEGMTSQEIGSLLKDANIIKDTNKLSNYLEDHDLAKKVQLGTFKLSSDMSIAEIAKEITS